MNFPTAVCVYAVLCALLGAPGPVRALRTMAADSSATRLLIAEAPSPSIRNCGGHSYDATQSVCITVGEQQWVCPNTAHCSCPTDRLGLHPFDCYDPSQYHCSSQSTEWPKSGLLPGAGLSDAGTCSVYAPGPAPALAPAAEFGQ